MARRIPVLAVALAALLSSSACQDYNFNPVGHCLLQPGTTRVTLSTVATADVLFVVDDSGSMLGEQANLASQFGSFINKLSDANAERVANGLDPIDFHIAITTTSMFRSPPVNIGSSCKNTCTGALGTKVCCLGNTNIQPAYCKADADCAAGYTCQTRAEATPIGGRGCFDASGNAQQIPCTTLGDDCSNVQHFYETWSGCSGGYADNLFTSNDEYPMGRFMAPSGNPLVLHFDKDLYCNWDAVAGACNGGSVNTPAINALIADFQANVAVGTCGSPEEQGVGAARAALQRVQGQYLVNGVAQGQTSGYTAGEFLHPNAKLVVIFVTDEDDCSSPADPASAVVFWESASSDGCKADAALPAADQREFSAPFVADYLHTLDRPIAAAFVASFLNGCSDVSCSPGYCCDNACTGSPSICTTATCGGQGVPNRYLDLANELKGRGDDVVLGSICDAFGGAGGTLERVAQVVKPPTGLELKTQPAAGEVTILRIAKADGTTQKTCYGPAPGALDTAGAIAAGYDWWFTAETDQNTTAQKDPVDVSRHIYINHLTLNCEANPGETYSLDYLGQVPVGGCLVDSDCSDALGGSESDWTCFAGLSSGSAPTCLAIPATRGTCICGSRATNCPNG